MDRKIRRIVSSPVVVAPVAAPPERALRAVLGRFHAALDRADVAEARRLLLTPSPELDHVLLPRPEAIRFLRVEGRGPWAAAAGVAEIGGRQVLACLVFRRFSGDTWRVDGALQIRAEVDVARPEAVESAIVDFFDRFRATHAEDGSHGGGDAGSRSGIARSGVLPPTPTYEDRYRVCEGFAGVPRESIVAAEREIGAALPIGYLEYVVLFGVAIDSDRARVYAPARVTGELAEWRQRIREHWHWDDSYDVLSRRRAAECVRIADTFDGDELAFHPEERDVMYVLPRDAHDARAVVGTFEQGLDALVARELPFFFVEPDDDRSRLRIYGGRAVHDAIVRALVALGIHARRLDQHDPGRGAATQIFFPSIGGLVTIEEHGEVVVRHRGDERSLAPITAALERLGLEEEVGGRPA
jgi:hypothetical protein